jgi:mxaJ protein
VSSSVDSVTRTKPYYRSTYTFVSRQNRRLDIASLDDPRLEKLKIGVHVVGNGFAPPAAALARRGLAANLVGYSLFGAYGEENPPERLMEALARGDVDLAIVWGPFAGYFAKQVQVPLDILPVPPAKFLAVPFTYEMSVGVRKGDDRLKDELDAVLARECRTIQAFLAEFGIPQGGAPQEKEPCEASSGSRSASPH